jgi:F-type H+-transporting ATPase subunit delta
MEASSRESLVQAREHLAELTHEPSGLLEKTKDLLTRQPRVTSAEELTALAEELFSVARLLDAQLSLRRALSDPSGKAEERAQLAQRLFASRVSPAAAELIETVARLRWSRPPDLVEAFTALGTEAALDAADVRGELEDVEDELFRFGRIVGGDRELARILSDRKAPAGGTTALLERLLSGKVSPTTEQLLRNTLTGPHAGGAEVAIERLSEVASRRRGQSVARVTTAVPLTPAQEQRLTAVLGRIYGRTIGLQVTVDPAVLGGLVVQVGDEVIDGSIAHRLDAAQRRLAG